MEQPANRSPCAHVVSHTVRRCAGRPAAQPARGCESRAAPRATRARLPTAATRARRRGHVACAASPPADGVGVVLVDHGSRKAESNELLLRLVDAYKAHTGRVVVHAAHMELAPPTIGDAFDACVSDGARTVVVSPYFLSPGRHWQEDLPALAAAAAARHPGVRYLVAAPLGLHPLVSQVLESRVQHCLEHAAGNAPRCDVCEAAGVECSMRAGGTTT